MGRPQQTGAAVRVRLGPRSTAEGTAGGEARRGPLQRPGAGPCCHRSGSSPAPSMGRRHIAAALSHQVYGIWRRPWQRPPSWSSGRSRGTPPPPFSRPGSASREARASAESSPCPCPAPPLCPLSPVRHNGRGWKGQASADHCLILRNVETEAREMTVPPPTESARWVCVYTAAAQPYTAPPSGELLAATRGPRRWTEFPTAEPATGPCHRPFPSTLSSVCGHPASSGSGRAH